MIRVLNIIASMNQGGAENFIMNVYRNIDREQFQFDFCMAKKESGFFEDEIRLLGGKIFKLDDVRKIGIRKIRKQFYEILEENHYDVVHCHMSTRCWIFLPIAKKNNVRIRIAHSHTSNVPMKTLKEVISNAMSCYVKVTHNMYANIFFACSKEAASWLFGKTEKHAVIVRNGIDTKKFIYNEEKRNNLRGELGIASDETLIGHVGRFTRQKNHSFLIEIFREYHKSNIKSKLLLIGSGELQERIQQKVKEYHLEKSVIFTGNLGNVYDYMSAMDIFLLPSLYEGLGIVLIEAQCSGLKCIISDLLPKEVDITDLIIRCSIKSSPTIWAEWIQEATGYVRESRDRQLSEAGYDIHSTVNVLEEIYTHNSNGEA